MKKFAIILVLSFWEQFAFPSCLEKVGGDNHGISFAVENDGNCLYLGNGAYLQIYDLENPVEPKIVSEILLDGVVTSIKLKDYPQNKKILFVTAHKYAIIIVDATDSKNPILLGKYKISGIANDISVKGTYAYVGVSDCGTFEGNGLYIFDISNLSEPKLLSYKFIKTVTGVDIYENYLFLSYISGLLVLDIKDPYNPKELAFVEILGYERRTKLKEKDGCIYAFICTGIGLDVIDVTDPLNPIVLSEWNYSVDDIKIEGDIAYIVNFFAGFAALDISDISNVKMIDYVPTSRRSTALSYPNGKYIYVSDYTALKIIDISNLDWFEVVNEFEISNWITGIKIYKDLLFAFVEYKGVDVYNISDIFNPQLVYTFKFWDGVSSLCFKENYLFIATVFPNSLIIYDISDIKNPVEISRIENPGYICCIREKDWYLYAWWAENGMYIIDVKDPYNPLIKNFIPKEDAFGFFRFYENFLIVYMVEYGIDIYDISNPIKPNKINHLEGHFSFADIIKDNLLVTNPYGIYAFSLSDVYNISFLGFAEIGGYPYNFVVIDDLAVVSSWCFRGGYGTYLLKISNPEDIKIIEFFENLSIPGGVISKDNLVIQVEAFAGFSIFDVSKCLKKHRRPF